MRINFLFKERTMVAFIKIASFLELSGIRMTSTSAELSNDCVPKITSLERARDVIPTVSVPGEGLSFLPFHQ